MTTPAWTAPDTPAHERVQDAHAQSTGQPPRSSASAPGTWIVAGTGADHYGGVIVVGLSDLRAAVAVSPRDDANVAVTGTFADTDAPESLGGRASALVNTLMSRQMLSRETAGLDITVVSDIPLGAGLGALHAFDAALAMALLSHDPEIGTAPLRTRLAEVCGQATKGDPLLVRARYAAALRGTSNAVAVVDYSDGSLTQAPLPQRSGLRVFSIAPSHGSAESAAVRDGGEALTEGRELIDASCTNFGVPSLRHLPDAAERIVEWVGALRDVRGEDAAVAPETARAWVAYGEAETKQGEKVSRALRSMKHSDLADALADHNSHPDLVVPNDLVELVTLRGALVARPAAAGMSDAVIAYVDAARAEEFVHAVTGDRLAVVEIVAGEPAEIA